MSIASNIDICIIPAAGRGSRWAPVSGYLPKEMLPLIDKPVIDWVIEEAINSGCNQIAVVINHQKKVIKDYLLNDKNLNKKAKLTFVNQEHPLGISHALLLCQKFINNQPFAVALPDLPTIAHKPVLAQLIQAFNQTKQSSHIISFNNFSPDTLHFYTECLLQQRRDKLLDIIHFCPKSSNNKPHHPGSKLRMSGRYVFKPEIIAVIDQMMKNFTGTEVKEFDALLEAIKQGHTVLGIDIQGHTYDTGNPLSYIRANTAFFKKRISKQR